MEKGNDERWDEMDSRYGRTSPRRRPLSWSAPCSYGFLHRIILEQVNFVVTGVNSDVGETI